MKAAILALCALASLDPNDCDQPQTTTADQKQAAVQAQALEQAHAEVGMPAISRWEEKKMAKDLYELRDKAIGTHAYIVNEMSGCLVYLGPSIGYGLPYATQYSAPSRTLYYGQGGIDEHPQAEPNGLFMPSAAEGTWIMLKDPNGDAVKPVYVEPRVIVSPFRLPAQECAVGSSPPKAK